MRKIYVLLIILFFSGICSVKAINADFTIDSIKISDKSNSIVVSDPSIIENNINSKIEFYNVSDFVKYKIVFKNNSDKEYRIKDIVNNYNGDYIDIKYEYNADIIRKNDSFDLYVIIKYVDEVI